MISEADAARLAEESESDDTTLDGVEVTHPREALEQLVEKAGWARFCMRFGFLRHPWRGFRWTHAGRGSYRWCARSVARPA